MFEFMKNFAKGFYARKITKTRGERLVCEIQGDYKASNSNLETCFNDCDFLILCKEFSVVFPVAVSFEKCLIPSMTNFDLLFEEFTRMALYTLMLFYDHY